MPSLQDALRADLSGYVPAVTQPPIILSPPTPRYLANPMLRFILPPFNSDPDTLRQFDNQSNTPKIRVMPLPQSSGGTTTIKETITSGGSSSSSSTSTSTTVTLTAKTVTFVTGILPAGASYTTAVLMAKSFQLIGIGVSSPCEVRIYGTASAQSTDAYRVTGAPVPAEVTPNIISCVTFDTIPYIWNWQNRCGANQDIPQTTNIYCTVLNTNPTFNNPVTVVIGYLPLEN